MAPAPNASVGPLNLCGCGVFLHTTQPNSISAGGSLVPLRSVSVLPLRWGLARKRGRVLDSRSADAVATVEGEASSGSSELRHIEKELTFSPTFTDYVKIMESVKLDRSKNLQGGHSDGRSPRRRFTGHDNRRAGWRSDDGRGKSFESKRGCQMDKGNYRGRGSKLTKSEIQKNVTAFVEKSAQSDAEKSCHSQGEIEEYVQRRIVRGEVRGTRGNMQFASQVKAKDTTGGMAVHQSARNKQVQSSASKDFQEREIETFDVSRTSAPPSTSILSKKTESKMGKEGGFTSTNSINEQNLKYSGNTKVSSKEVHADSNFQKNQKRVENLGRNFVSHRSGENAMEGKKPILSKQYGHVETVPRHNGRSSDSLKHDKPEIIHMKRRENVKMGKFAGRDAESAGLDNRAAFKTFEVFSDVRNRPRILRMEMEERIQKLASRLNATDVNAPEWKFSKIIHDAKIKFSDHSILRIVQMLGRFGNWKRVLQVVEWLQSRERFKSYKSRYIYTTVLDVLGKAKKPFEALNVFYTMQNQLSSYPDMAAYHCIAVTLGQAGLMKELFDVMDCMRSPPRKKFKLGPLQNWDPRLEPDLIVYNAVLNACVQQKQWEGAFWVLQQLKEKNIKPTNTTYGLVMEVMLACGKYSLVYEFFNKVEKSTMPGALNYKVLINALWREGKIDEAVMAVKDMENRGIVGSASLYYDLARCLCSGGRCKEALLQVPNICKVANKPLVVTYTGLIQTCIDNGSMENAKYIFNEMCNYCSPNNVTCNIMLKSYVEQGMFEDAKDLLYNILNGRIRSKVDLNQSAVADKFTFNTFMEACAEANRWDDFEYAFRKMLSNGYHFDERRHLRMVLDAYRSGKEPLLDDLWHYLCHHSRVPPAPLIMERFCLKLIRGDTNGAISCISSFEEGKIRSVSSMSWLNLLTRNRDHLKEEDITKRAAGVRLLCQRGAYIAAAAAAQWLPLASSDHASEAAQEAREEDHVTASRRLLVSSRCQRRMCSRMVDGFTPSWIALVALALHLAVYGCSAVNLEESALLEFQSRVEEDPHGAMAGWNRRGGDACSWNGVSCVDGRVVMLNLKGFSLKGTLGPELGTLNHLRALVLSNNLFSGPIPKEISALVLLEILDLSNNNLTGEVPQEIAEMQSLKHLFLSSNNFQRPVIRNSYGNLDLENDFVIYDNLERDNMDQRTEHGFGPGSSSEEKDSTNLSAHVASQFASRNPAAQLSQRRLLQDSNLAAPSGNGPAPAAVAVPSTGTGSFSAFSPSNAPEPAVDPPPVPSISPATPTDVRKGKSSKWLYIILPLSILLLIGIVVCLVLLCRNKSVKTIGPWKTGLSGQLQKAFVTGVPKLQRSELEGACEDFSNIVASYPHYTVYKGTLSNGVEIAVVSTMITSSKDWSKHSEGRFRKKIDLLSRINHKNFINLLGYCEEEEPFMRMMVLEYAPNGTLYEHLHVEGFDPIDWNGRMRVIMGVAYCTQHMHELSPPMAHPDLKSSAILLSEDGAAKIADMSVWKEVYSKGNMPKNDDYVDDHEPVAADPAGNVYSFGLLMLEIISGKPPYSEQDSLTNMALECIRDGRSMSYLLDPALKAHKEKDLGIICELIQACIQRDPKKRPSMGEVTTRLREVIGISPEAATPRLSPLWWAELEILSVEAS